MVMEESSEAPDKFDLEVAGDGSSKKVSEGVVADVERAEIEQLEGIVEEAKVEYPKPSSSSVDIVGGTTLQDCSDDADANIQDSGCKEDRRTEYQYQILSDTVVDGQSQVYSVEANQEGGRELGANHDNGNISPQADLIAKDPVLEDPVVEVELQEIGRETEVCNAHMLDVGQDSSHKILTSLADTNRNIQEDPTPWHGSPSPEPADPVVTVQTQVTGGQSEAGDESMLNLHKDWNQEASVTQDPTVSITADDGRGGQADHVTEEIHPSGSIVEVQHQEMGGETEVLKPTMDDRQRRDQKASFSPKDFLPDTTVLDAVHVEDTLGPQADHSIVDKTLTDTVPAVQPQVREKGSDKSFDSNPVGDIIDHQTDFVSEDANLDDSSIKSQDKMRNIESNVDNGFMMKGDEVKDEVRLVHEVPTLQISSVQTTPGLQEGDTRLKSNKIDDGTGSREGLITKDQVIADMAVEMQLQDNSREMEGGDVHMVDADQGSSGEASALQTSLVDTNQNVQEGGIALELDPFDRPVTHQDGHATANGDSADPFEPEVSAGSDVDEGREGDSEASASRPSLLETNQHIQGEVHGDANSGNDGQLGSRYPVLTGAGLACNVLDLAAESADTRQFDENAIVQGDITNADANHVIESQSEGIQLTDRNPNGEEDIAELVTCSVGKKEDGGTGSLGEKLIMTRDTVLQNSNSEMGSSTLSEIRDVLSEGTENIELPYDTNQNIVIQSVGTSVDGDLGANSHKLESSLGKSQNSATDLEVIKNDMPPPTACFKTVESIQESEPKQETGNPSNTRNVLMDEGTGGKKDIQVGKGEMLKGTEKHAVQCVATNTELSIMEKKQHISYNLPSLDKTNFFMSDLVWGKVKSHPWWPGQIFDPSVASRLALKYQKKGNFLVAYFGDKTFAWCDGSQLKSFYSYYSQMEKQCNADTFVIGVNDILVEISRRVELGMSCSCLPEEACANIKLQKVVNAGVREGNITSVLDRHLILNYFRPSELMGYIKTLAQFPNGGVDRLELVLAKSQLKAFYSSKGYPELPVFTVEGELIEDVFKISSSNVEGSGEDSAKHYNPVLSDLIHGKGKLRSKEKSFKKRKHVPEEDRKYKSMSDLTDEENALHLGYGGESKFSVEDSEKLTPSFVAKNTTFGSDSVEKGKHKRTLHFFGDVEPASPSPTVTSSFKIGEFIRRAASQLAVAPPIIKCRQETFQKNIPQADRNQGDVTDFDVLPHAPPDEMLSQLCLTAIDPLNGNDFVSMMVVFFTSFRNSCVSCTSEGNMPAEKRKRGRPRKVISQMLFSDISSSDDKNVEKRKRCRSKQQDSKPVISDISSSEKQHDNKCSSQDQHVQKRRRGRPKKVILKPAISDISSSEEKQHAEKRKRGRQKKVTTQLASSDICTPDHMQDSYWSSTKLQKRPRRKSFSDEQKVESHKKIRQKKKSAGERPLSLPSGSMMENEQLQVVPTNLNTKYSLVAERPIICVKEKEVDERVPTALILSFSSSGTLPSVTDLIRIFSRYGPLKEAETDVLRKSNRAKVVFKRLADAEAAFSRAGSTFGPGLLSYQLKYMPGSPKPTCETNPQVQNDATSTARPKENHDTASIITPQDYHNPEIATQGNHNPATLVTPHKHDEAPMAAPQDKHDTTPTSKPQDDSGPISTPQNEKGPMQVCNIEISELSPCDKYDSTYIPQAEDCHDAASTAMPQAEHDSTVITTSGDYDDAAPITTIEDKYNATQIESSNLPQDKHDVMPINETWVDRDASFIAAPQDSHNVTLDTGSQDYQDATPTATLPENFDATQEHSEINTEVDITLAEAEG